MQWLNTVPKDKKAHFVTLLQKTVDRVGVREAASITGLSTGHIRNVLSCLYEEMTVSTGQKILKGYKASKHL